MKRRIAVVGLGSIGKRHSRLLHEREEVELEVVEPDAQVLQQARQQFSDIKVHANFEDMLSSHPDAVWICTPTRFHAEQTIAALAAGTHVFCEKPMAATLEEARRMRAAADRAHAVLNIGFYLHFWDGMLRLKELVTRGELGTVLHAHARVGSYTTLVNSISRYQARQPGSLLFDYAHQPDLFYWLLDATPRSVWAAGFQGGSLELSSAPNVIDLVSEYSHNLVTTLHLNYVQLPERHEYEITGDRGWASVDFFSGCLRIGSRIDGSLRTETVVQQRDDIFRAEHRAFFDMLDGRRGPETSAADGLVSTAVCEAALESWRTGMRVPLSL